MSRSLPFALFAAIVLSSITGCASNRATATLTPGTDLGAVKSYYVVQGRADTRGIENLIRENLAKRGFAAYAGPEMSSYRTNAIVTYQDKWMWDITMYMIELTVTIRDPASNFPLAVGNSYHTSLTRKSSEEMVDEVLSNIFSKTQVK
jgi:hypothetical protein